MSYEIHNFTDAKNRVILDQKGPFSIIEYQKDLSVLPTEAIAAYYCSEMNIKRRQLLCDLSAVNGITIQAGAMQWMLGNVNATTGVHGVGDLLCHQAGIHRRRNLGLGAYIQAYHPHGCLQLGRLHRFG